MKTTILSEKIAHQSAVSRDGMYTTLKKAKVEVWQRWNDAALRRRVEEFLQGDIPDFLRDNPKACLARVVATPNFEFFHFLELAKKISLPAVCPEYLDDIFTTQNTQKYYLGKIVFYSGDGKNGGKKIRSEKIIDFNTAEGSRLSEVMTLGGEKLVEVHHRMLRQALPDYLRRIEIHDGSAWLKKKAASGRNFYLAYLSLFICHGVLFEDFLMNEEEKKFTTEVVMPAFQELKEMFGIQPLIVPLTSVEHEEREYWTYYPDLFSRQ